MNFTGINLCRYEISLCKRCLGCQRMELDDFIPQMKCNQAVLMVEDVEQIKIEEIRESLIL